MTDRYQITADATDIARSFAAVSGDIDLAERDIVPGGQGLVVRENDGHRLLTAMTWGFPLHPSKAALARHPKAKPKPVNKAKGLTRYFWKDFAESQIHRCLIPVERFIEGPANRGTRNTTWFSLPDQPLFALAGLWRPSEEWGDVYAAVMTEACSDIAPVHDRMPVILHPEDWNRWLHGTLDDVLDLQRTYDGAMSVTRE
jgi:putative SOS response-associated peptidase YedK